MTKRTRDTKTQTAFRKKQKKERTLTMTMTELGLPVGTPVKIAGISQFTYLIEPISENEVFLLNVDTHEHLKCGPQRNIKNLGGRGEYCKWQVTGSLTDGFSIQNVGHRNSGKALYLGTNNGNFVAIDHPEPLTFEPVDNDGQYEHAPSCADYKLSDDERKTFVKTGVLRLPHLVDQQLVDKALSHINEALGMAWEGDDSMGDRKSYEVPGVRDLIFKTPIMGVLEQMLGKGMAKLHQGGQIALRFPNNRVPGEAAWHIDGSSSTHMNPFQVLVGIALSSQPTDDCGNLVVFPGKHVEAHNAVARMREDRKASGSEKPGWLGHRPNITQEDSVQLKLEPGDVVLAHQMMPHRVAHNSSPNIRYMVYFRISHKNHKPNGPLGGLWAHFEGLQDMTKSCSADEGSGPSS